MIATDPTKILDSMPPVDIDAERAVLGSVMVDQDRLDDVALMLRPDDFYSPVHQLIYRTMLDMHNGGKRLDARLLISRMLRDKTFSDIGQGTTEQERLDSAAVYLQEILDSFTLSSNATYYAEHVRETATLRAIRLAGSEIMREAHNGDGGAKEILRRVESRFFGLLERGSLDGVRQLGDVLHEAIAAIDERVKNKNMAGIPTGFFQLDRTIGGLRPGELIVIAARPSVGKTVLGANIAERVSVRSGNAVLFISLEMSRMEIAERLLSSSAEVNGDDMKQGRTTSEQKQAIVRASCEMSQAPLFIDDVSGRSVLEIASCARRLKRTDELSLIIVDYLQLIEPENRKDNREQQVAVMSRRLKQLARELKIPVICLAQLNREAEKGNDHTPRLAQLRESGAIEQDADVVILLHREDMYRDPKDWDNKAVAIVAKNRNGRRGKISLEWEPQYVRFQDANAAFNADEWQYPGDGGF